MFLTCIAKKRSENKLTKQRRFRMAELSKLPQEMKVQILSRLPPKSLMRFKCVNTSWHALISSPNFAAKHVSISKHNKLSSTTTILFKRYVLDLNTDKKEIILSLFDLCHDNNCVDDDDHLNPMMEDLHVPQCMGLKRRDIWTGIEFIEIACQCNGIICLTDYRKRVVLCNPAIKEFNRLPVSSLALSSADIKPNGSSTAAVGFGCDLKSEDYKVVRILYSAKEYKNDDHLVTHPPKAEVFSLVTRSWKEIKTNNLDNESTNIWPDSTVCIFCKGNLYWRGHEEQKECFDVSSWYEDQVYNNSGDETDIYEDKERIISFDIGSETFHVISFPNGYYYYHKVFGLWNDSIAVSTSWCPEDQGIQIWVLDNIGGVERSWINCLTIEPVVHIEFPLAFVGRSGQSLLLAPDDCVVILYDFITAKLKYLPINGVSLWSTQALFYVSSVVSIKG